MQQDVITAVEQGAAVLAASQRLARVLTASFTERQRLQGRSVWKSPDILPWGAFLDRLWRQWLLAADAACPLLLNSTQELALWEDVIRESPEGSRLLQIPETAEEAMQAWMLIHAYRLPRRAGQFGASEDCAAFSMWAKEFERRLNENGWIEPARLPDVLAGLLRDGKLSISQRLYLAGFDELTPQQEIFIEALGDTDRFSPESVPAIPMQLGLRDASDELRKAAAWARERLERNPEAQIGVILPDLQRLRSQAERIFTAVFHPALETASRGKAFHISLGAPLAEAPIIHAALVILELGAGELYLSRLGTVLRGPFLAGAERERSQRAQLDARLRKVGLFRAGTRKVGEWADRCPLLQAAFHNIERQLEKLPPVQSPSAWSRSFAQVLKAAGWPGDRTLSSEEFQAIRSWNDVLSRFATLDLVSEPISFGRALDKLRQIARQKPFQAEDEGARVALMGLFESSGLGFDHLWVMGLHDEALPGSAHPNPFLPLELQRSNGLPHSSAARELEVATTVMHRLLASASELVLSSPRQEGDRQLGPSPLLVGVNAAAAASESPTWLDVMRSSAELEAIADPAAPPVAADTVHTGGTWLLRDMAACHFRAWALNRAGARPLEEPEAGISSRDSGKAVHTALELIWKELQTHRALCSMGADQKAQLVARHVRTAVEKTTGLGRALEQRRLTKLLLEWLEIEKRRPAFTVFESEATHEIRLGGIQIMTRFDRVDQLEDGRHVILDYKTGLVKAGCWGGDRPDEPQLPLYCASNDQTIAAAAFVQIRTGELGFRGVAEEPHALPELKRMDVLKGAPLSALIAEWRRIFERLAGEFCGGNAAVNPKQHACDYCPLTALCRIRDVCDSA